MDDDQKGLLYLFERPFEPLKIPRAGGTILFQQEGEEDEDLATLFGSSGTTMMNVPSRPNILSKLPKCMGIPRGVPLSTFDPDHRAATKELTDLLMDPVALPQLTSHAASIKDNMNEALFIYALSFAIISNPAFDSRLVPSIVEVFPSKFIPQETIQLAMDEVKSIQFKNPENVPEEIVVPHNVDIEPTGSSQNPEFPLAYWREDYGLNSHHWHWHLVFSNNDRDRKGEIFSYMHNQMMARYDWERLSNSLDRVVSLNKWREPIPEGYFPKLTIDNSSRHYGNRPDNMIPQVFQVFALRPNYVDDMERFTERFSDAFQKGYMIHENGENVPISDNVAPGEQRGIDIVGNAFEPNEGSVNIGFYGWLHGMGHVMVAGIHDPFGHHRGDQGVIGDPATACRDPAFYRWHKFVDDVFQEYKMQQVPYEDKELVFEAVEVESVAVKSGTLEENVLETGWDIRTIEASRGLDFFTQRPIKFELQHLTHRPFAYNIQVTNNQTDPVDVTVRLYMAPKVNEAGEPMTFMDQRLLWAEMDKYQTTLQPGSNTLERLSTDSSITIAEEMTFRDLEENPPEAGDPKADYCGCGWPQHLLIPKGKAEGMDFQILALISDWEEDKGQIQGVRNCLMATASRGSLGLTSTGYKFMKISSSKQLNPILINPSIRNNSSSNRNDTIFKEMVTVKSLVELIK
ncbi:unnamed protein product, partial [Meganyctiphanes norvegica]